MRRLVLACMVIILLTACGHATTLIEPTATPVTDRASHPPSAPPTAEPPVLPAIAKRNDTTGAANFVVYWVKVFNYAARTGDTDEMERFASQCDVCTSYADDFKTLPRNKRLRADAWTLSDISVEESDSGFDVSTTVHALAESKPYGLTFVVRKGKPLELVHIYERP